MYGDSELPTYTNPIVIMQEDGSVLCVGQLSLNSSVDAENHLSVRDLVSGNNIDSRGDLYILAVSPVIFIQENKQWKTIATIEELLHIEDEMPNSSIFIARSEIINISNPRKSAEGYRLHDYTIDVFRVWIR
jgi:hypothetical protein